MITSVSATNFKAWKSTGDVRLAPITGLFGSNSSGKSSFLQLLLLLKQTTESPDRSLVFNFGDDRSLVELGVFTDVLHNHAKEQSLSLGLSWQLPKPLLIADPEEDGGTLFEGRDLSFQTSVDANGAGRLAVQEMLYSFANRQFGMRRKGSSFEMLSLPEGGFLFKRTQGRPWDLPAPTKCYGFPDQVKAYFQNAAFVSLLELELEKLLGRVYYLGPLREYPKRQYVWAGGQPTDMGRRGESVVDALLASRETKISRGKGRPKWTVEQFVADWLKRLGMIESFEVRPINKDGNLHQVWVRTRPGSAEVLLTDVGFGVSQILPVLTLCYYVPEGSTILMEQPEIHLHPSVQAGLADVFVEVVKDRSIQIIVESHSEHLLRRLQRRIAEEELQKEHAALFFFDLKKHDTQLTPLRLNMFGEIENWPEGFFGDEFGEHAAMASAKTKRLRNGRSR